jgi:hydroxymethylglutaryl-CoA lyase
MTTPAGQPLRAEPPRVRIVEVGPRDGLQMEPVFVPTELKVEILERLAAAGLAEIEATSFVHPRVIPQTADAEEVMRRLHRAPGVRWLALVPNLKGAERALAVGVDELRLVVAATESYNRRNVGLSIDESARLFGGIVELAARRGTSATVAFAVALGCPLEGTVPPERLAELCGRFVELGAEAIGIADTYGLAHPRQVRETVPVVRQAIAGRRLWLHLHDTRGLGLANTLAALDVGVDSFDAAFGGLGGTPILPGASGNVATEDLVYLCEEMGIATGVDLDRLREVSSRVAELLGKPLPSHVLRSGTRAEMLERMRSTQPA